MIIGLIGMWLVNGCDCVESVSYNCPHKHQTQCHKLSTSRFPKLYKILILDLKGFQESHKQFKKIVTIITSNRQTGQQSNPT